MKEIIMPKLGLTMEEGRVVSWLKKEGDPIEKGELLLEVETDKSINEVEASYSGTIGKIYIQVDETAAVLSVIGYILEPGEKPPDEWPVPGSTREVKFEVGKATQRPAEKLAVKASPVAQRIAEEKGVDLSKVKGSGTGGKITKEDVLAASKPALSPAPTGKIKISPRARRLAREKNVPIEAVSGSGPEGRILEEDVLAYLEKGPIQELSKLKKITAERMSASFTSAPHFYLKVDLNATELVAVRKQMLPDIEKETGIRLTFSDLFIFLVSRVLVKHPIFGASYQAGNLVYADGINLGLAIAVEDGLVVPVLKQADEKDLKAIVLDRSSLVGKAQKKRLDCSDLESGSFTISNLGMFGIDSFSAILNPPESAILAIGRITEKVLPSSNGIVVAPVVSMTLSVDHRVLDGADGARFLQDLREAIENPALYLS